MAADRHHDPETGCGMMLLGLAAVLIFLVALALALAWSIIVG